jgi:hypothetical protein
LFKAFVAIIPRRLEKGWRGNIMLQRSEKASVRDLEREDLPAVAQLFQKTFRKSEHTPPSLVAHLHEILFAHPWQDSDLPSKILVSESGRIQGFIGVFPGRLELGGQSLRAAFAGSLMVENPEANPLAGARLIRAFLAGPQDLSLTETANATALGMWQKLSLPFDVGYSLNWLRVFRPATTAVRLMEKNVGAARVFKPMASVADIIAANTRLSTLRFQPQSRTPRIRFREATRAEFRDATLILKDQFPLRPQWDIPSLDWLIDQASQKRQFGTPFWRVGETRTGGFAGAYAYFGRAGSLGWLLQALCSPDAAGDLVEDLFAHADAAGCAGLRGAGHPWLTPELITRKTSFHGRAFYLAHARDQSLLEPIRSGRALISGLAGESWMRLIGDSFD